MSLGGMGGGMGGSGFPGSMGKPQSIWDLPPEQQAEAGARAMMEMMQSCPGKMVMSGSAGFVLGGVMGIFLSSMSYDTAMGLTEASKIAHLPFRQQMKIQFTDMGKRAYSTAKSFGFIGGVYSGVECAIESLRAKTDIYNHLWAGCLTGGGLAIRGGPQGALLGCGGFALFSLAIETFLSDHSKPPTSDEDE